MINFYKRNRPSEEHDSIDALLALQMLEEQEQTQEQEFYRITDQIQRFGRDDPELERELPKLLKTKRERALYNAFMMLIKTPQDSMLPQIASQTHQERALHSELRGFL